MKKRHKLVNWISRPGDVSARICPECGQATVYCYGILTDVEYKRRRCREEAGGCGYEFETGGKS